MSVQKALSNNCTLLTDGLFQEIGIVQQLVCWVSPVSLQNVTKGATVFDRKSKGVLRDIRNCNISGFKWQFESRTQIEI